MNTEKHDPATPEDPYFGRMNAPTAASSLTGPCGDTMEFYLAIENGTIVFATYYTTGCGHTRACGHEVARLATGRTVVDALCISAGELIRAGICDAQAGYHCAILATSAFYRAAADYLLMP